MIVISTSSSCQCTGAPAALLTLSEPDEGAQDSDKSTTLRTANGRL
jgi:hypothetical protein